MCRMREVPGLARGVRILDLLATRRTGVGRREVAEALGLPRSATYELVNTLRNHRVVEVTDSGEVILGSKLFMYGSAYSATVDLARLATAAAEAASAQLGETVQVGILGGAHVLCIAKAESQTRIRLVSAVGQKLPAQCTGMGKALLASLDPDDFARTFAQIEWTSLTPTSVLEPDVLIAELEQVRQQGWALDNCESTEDVCCVAAVVHDSSGAVIAAMSVSSLAARLTDSRREHFVDAIVSAADNLSASLGYAAVSSRSLMIVHD